MTTTTDFKTQEFLTADEVAAVLSVCRLTVYRLIKSNRLIAYRIGRGAYRILQDDLNAFLENCRSSADA